MLITLEPVRSFGAVLPVAAVTAAFKGCMSAQTTAMTTGRR
ncbi:MAG: hypothetical protein ABSA65_17390 [Acidimicrobiales bacterium]